MILRRATEGGEPMEPTNPLKIERLVPAITWYVAEPPGGAQKELEILHREVRI